MRARVFFLGCAVLGSLGGCEDAGSTTDPSSADAGPASERSTAKNEAGRAAPAPTPWAGGTTSDFGGSCAACRAPEHASIALDDDEVLGFTAQQVLDVVEGLHSAAVRWRDPCDGGACDVPAEGCPRAAPSFAGDVTELRVEIERAGEPELETCPEKANLTPPPGSYLQCTGTFLVLPLRAHVRTTDGVLDFELEDQVMRVEPGAAGIGLGELVPRDRLDGTLATDLPALVEIEWTLWFDRYGTGTDLYVLGAENDAHPENGRQRENLAQLEAAGADECLVGFPLQNPE